MYCPTAGEGGISPWYCKSPWAFIVRVGERKLSSCNPFAFIGAERGTEGREGSTEVSAAKLSRCEGGSCVAHQTVPLSPRGNVIFTPKS